MILNPFFTTPNIHRFALRSYLAIGQRLSLNVIFFLVVGSVPSQGGIFYVNHTQDTTQVTSLRGAVMQANIWNGNNTIILSEGTYQLTIPNAHENNARTGDLDITKGNLTILGIGSNVIISASSLGDRVFHIWPDACVKLVNLRITGGTAVGGTEGRLGGKGENGGGIYNAGALMLDKCVVSNSVSGTGGISTRGFGIGGNGGKGGGIYNERLLILNNSIVSDNSTGAGGEGNRLLGNGGSNTQGGNGGEGGGIYNVGTMIMNTSTVRNNFTGAGGILYGNSGDGGGIYNVGRLSLNGCTVIDNFSASAGSTSGHGGNGGGIYNIGTLSGKTTVIGGNAAGLGGVANDSYSFGGGAGGNGGGLYNSGTTTLNNCTMSNNMAGGGASGGSTLTSGSGNEGANGGAGGSGGGLYNTARLILNSCTIDENRSGVGGPGGAGQSLSGGSGGKGGSGAAIYSGGTLTVSLCTISGNIGGKGGDAGAGFGGGVNGGSGGEGGGIYNVGRMKLNASTLVLNSTGSGAKGGKAHDFLPVAGGSGGTGGRGGGIFNATNGAFAHLNSTLIALNSVGLGGAGGEGDGGIGILYPSDPDPANVSPFRGLDGADGSGFDLSGNFTSGGYNLIGQNEGSGGFTNRIAADIVGTHDASIDPHLGPFQNNGGRTFTHALLPGSPAIDQGRSLGLGKDQRGQRRPHDFASISNAIHGDGCDIGAFELDTPFLSINRGPAGALLGWDSSCKGYIVESTTNMNLRNGWTPVSGTSRIINGQNQITHDGNTDYRFFRLQKH